MKIDEGMAQRTDRELLADMDSGSRERARAALQVLYERHAPTVLSFLSRLEGDVNVAEDILQESFLVASRKAGRFQHGSARPWLLSIAASRLRAARREARRRTRREAQAAERTLPTSPPRATQDAELEAALATLPAKERAVLELRFQAGLGFREVAEVLGISLRSAKSWSASGLERLRHAMGGSEERE